MQVEVLPSFHAVNVRGRHVSAPAAMSEKGNCHMSCALHFLCDHMSYVVAFASKIYYKIHTSKLVNIQSTLLGPNFHHCFKVHVY